MQVKATVITALDEEHMEALGGSLQSIAAAKAGIIQPSTLAVIAPQPRQDAQHALQNVITSMPNVKTVWISPSAFSDAGVQWLGALQLCMNKPVLMTVLQALVCTVFMHTACSNFHCQYAIHLDAAALQSRKAIACSFADLTAALVLQTLLCTAQRPTDLDCHSSLPAPPVVQATALYSKWMSLKRCSRHYKQSRCRC
jgi:hypothetical protein